MPGRNDPCHCGSGKKYKRCCHDADQRAKAPMQAAPVPYVSTANPAPSVCASGASTVQWVYEDDGLDDLSNSVIDLIEEKRFDEALVVCQRLLDEFTDVHDGFERSALVHRAMGNHALAAHFFRKTYEFANDPVRRRWYDQDVLDEYREDMEREERLAGLR